MFFAIRSKAPKIRFRTIWETVAEDATWYFLVIFTAHLVFVFTLNLAPVSAAVFCSWYAVANGAHLSKRSNSSQLCKCSPSCPENNHPHLDFFHRNQRDCSVRLYVRLVQITYSRFQISARDDFSDNAFVEEICASRWEGLGFLGRVYDQYDGPRHYVQPAS